MARFDPFKIFVAPTTQPSPLVLACGGRPRPFCTLGVSSMSLLWEADWGAFLAGPDFRSNNRSQLRCEMDAPSSDLDDQPSP